MTFDDTMSGGRVSPSQPSWKIWSGRILSGLVILFLVLDATMKLLALQLVLDTAGQLGWPVDPGLWRLMGAILLGATLLYAFPQTSYFGAIVLTGYLGGAVATHTRVGSPLISHTLFGVYLGVALWGGLWLRDPRLRTLLRY